MDLLTQGVSRTCINKYYGKPKEIAKIWNFLHLQSFVETDPIESQWICRNKEFPTPARCLKTYPGFHLGETRRQFSFPARTDISIPLSDWSRDSVAPTHKYCRKLEFRSYAL